MKFVALCIVWMLTSGARAGYLPIFNDGNPMGGLITSGIYCFTNTVTGSWFSISNGVPYLNGTLLTTGGGSTNTPTFATNSTYANTATNTPNGVLIPTLPIVTNAVNQVVVNSNLQSYAQVAAQINSLGLTTTGITSTVPYATYTNNTIYSLSATNSGIQFSLMTVDTYFNQTNWAYKPSISAYTNNVGGTNYFGYLVGGNLTLSATNGETVNYLLQDAFGDGSGWGQYFQNLPSYPNLFNPSSSVAETPVINVTPTITSTFSKTNYPVLDGQPQTANVTVSTAVLGLSANYSMTPNVPRLQVAAYPFTAFLFYVAGGVGNTTSTVITNMVNIVNANGLTPYFDGFEFDVGWFTNSGNSLGVMAVDNTKIPSGNFQPIISYCHANGLKVALYFSGSTVITTSNTVDVPTLYQDATNYAYWGADTIFFDNMSVGSLRNTSEQILTMFLNVAQTNGITFRTVFNGSGGQYASWVSSDFNDVSFSADSQTNSFGLSTTNLYKLFQELPYSGYGTWPNENQVGLYNGNTNKLKSMLAWSDTLGIGYLFGNSNFTSVELSIVTNNWLNAIRTDPSGNVGNVLYSNQTTLITYKFLGSQNKVFSPGSVAVAALNFSTSTSTNVSFNLTSIGLSTNSTYNIYSVFQGMTNGSCSSGYTNTVATNSAEVFVFSPITKNLSAATRTNWISGAVYVNASGGKWNVFADETTVSAATGVTGFQLLYDPLGGTSWQTNCDGSIVEVALSIVGMSNNQRLSGPIANGGSFVWSNISTVGSATLKNGYISP